MTLLIVGLLLFLGVHSVRIVAEDWRAAQIARIGALRWKGAYTLASIVGLTLVVWGYGVARRQPVVLWPTAAWQAHVAVVLTLLAFVLITAAYMPGNHIKATLQHPMVLGVKVWALAHLIANNSLADLLLFGSFLLWAAFSFRAARARDRALGTRYAAGTLPRTAAAVALGVAVWAVFLFWGHVALTGVRPLG